METVKEALKLIKTHALVSIVVLLIMTPLMAIWQSKEIYQWIIAIICIVLFWLVIYYDINNLGQRELKRDSYRKSKGFVIGAIASIPGMVVYILSILMANNGINYWEVALRIWLAPYTRFFLTFENNMPYIAVIPIGIFPLLTGFSYLDSLRKRNIILEAIKDSNATRAEKSKIGRD